MAAGTREDDRRLRQLSWLLHGVGAALLALGALAAWLVLFRPLEEAADQCRAEAAALVAKMSDAEQVRREYAELAEQLRALQERAQAIKELIPDEPREAEFLRLVTLGAAAEGVTVRDFGVGPHRERPDHSEITLDLSLEGDYPAICRFLDRLAQIPRASALELFQLQAPADRSAYPVTMRLTLYFGVRAPEASSGSAPHAAG